jgi:hypothetical protein
MYFGHKKQIFHAKNHAIQAKNNKKEGTTSAVSLFLLS